MWEGYGSPVVNDERWTTIYGQVSNKDYYSIVRRTIKPNYGADMDLSKIIGNYKL